MREQISMPDSLDATDGDPLALSPDAEIPLSPEDRLDLDVRFQAIIGTIAVEVTAEETPAKNDPTLPEATPEEPRSGKKWGGSDSLFNNADWD